MDESDEPILVRGQYRVAVPHGGPGRSQLPLAPHAYVVLDHSGRWLRQESTLELARDWIDRRIREEQELDQLVDALQLLPGIDARIVPTPGPARAKPRRSRR